MFFDPYTESVLTNIGINIVLTLSLYFPLAVGQLSIAQVGFMAMAPTWQQYSPYICMPRFLSRYWPRGFFPAAWCRPGPCAQAVAGADPGLRYVCLHGDRAGFLPQLPSHG